MPELPDVEAHRRTFAEHAAGRRVVEVTVPDPDVLTDTTPQGLGRALSGRRFAEPGRHGKWLLAGTGDGGPVLAVHFRMTGTLAWTAEGDVHDDDAVVLRFEDGALHVRTVRRFTEVRLIPAGDEPQDHLGPLGPDAWTMDRGTFDAVLDGRGGGIKSALMEQELIAGLGNLLVDELLWRARVHPRAAVAALDDRRDELWSAMREVLRQSIAAGHVPSGPTWINAQRGADDPRCPRCDAALRRTTVAGRTTWWCPAEQHLHGL